MSASAWRAPADLLGETRAEISVGDIIRTSANFHPHYHIIALADDRGWIRDTQHGTDHVVPIERCRKA